MNELVIKSNKLIEAKYDLSVVEQKIILLATTKLDTDDTSFQTVTIPVAEFGEVFETDNHRYTELRNIIKRLAKKQVFIQEANGDEIIAQWLASCKYVKDKGEIELSFAHHLIPYLLQLKSCFTSYKLANVIQFDNKYSLRIYELAMQYMNMKDKKRLCDLEEFKKMIGAESKYSKLAMLKKRVLDPAITEINAYSDINIDYKLCKTGRKVTAIEFSFSKKQDVIIADQRQPELFGEENTIEISTNDTLKKVYQIIYEYTEDPEIRDVLQMYVEDNNDRGKMITPNQLKLQLKKLDTFQEKHQKIMSIEKSIENGYSKLYSYEEILAFQEKHNI